MSGRISIIRLLSLILTCALLPALPAPRADAGPVARAENLLPAAPLAAADEAERRRVLDAYGKLPMRFEANVGQSPAQVRFQARGNGYLVYLTPEGAILRLHRRRPGGGFQRAGLRLKLEGANPNPEIAGVGELPGKSNYLRGTDRRDWRTDIANYLKVEYRGVYPGIDAVYYGNGQHLEYDFNVAAGADPGRIRLSFAGVRRLSVDRNGDLRIDVAGETVFQKAPVAFQEIDGKRRSVAARYAVERGNRVRFVLGSYDRSRLLVIDPVLRYSTYLGGLASDEINGIAVDSFGNAYVTGTTFFNTFPMTSEIESAEGPFDNDNVKLGLDGFVTKLNAAGTQIVYSTILGGSFDDVVLGIALDPSGQACITGASNPSLFPTLPDFTDVWPTTATAYQSNVLPGVRGTLDAFVTVLNSFGNDLVYSSFFGGFRQDRGNAISVDADGKIYITGETESGNLATPRGFQRGSAGDVDAFLAVFDPTGFQESSLVYATYIGGSLTDRALGVAVDPDRNAYVVGETLSSDFPTKSPSSLPPFQGHQGDFDAFAVKIDAAQRGDTSLVYSTCLGGERTDRARAVAVDRFQRIYVTGNTNSESFPLLNAFDNTRAGVEAFVTKFNADGTAIFYSSLLGGRGEDEGRGIAIDIDGNAYVTGRTSSGATFPLKNPLAGVDGGGVDAFLVKVVADGSAIAYSTLLGGGGDDRGNGVGVRSNGDVFVAGTTTSEDFPVTEGAFDTEVADPPEGFIVRVSPLVDLALAITDSPDPVTVGSEVAYRFTVTNAGPEEATNVRLFVALPDAAQAQFVSASTGCVPNGNSVDCELGVLPAGGSAIVAVSLRPLQAGVIQVLGLVSGRQLDNGPGPNIDVESTTVQDGGPLADLRVQVVDSPDPVARVGANLTYTITLTNNGPNAASSVTLTSGLDPNVQFVSLTSKGSCTTPPVGASGTVTCNFASLNAGVSTTLTLVVRTNAGNAKALSLQTNANSATPDPNLANNTVTTATGLQ